METTNKKRIGGLLAQIATIFAIATLLVGLLAFSYQQVLSDRAVKSQFEQTSHKASKEVESAIKQYPAWEWILTYWHQHWEEMDIEYDAVFEDGTETEKKEGILDERHPGLHLQYATTEQVERMPAEDQKLYAEVVYSWLLTRINQIKSSQDIDFVFCVMTDDAYKEQFFMFSGANPGIKRGRTSDDAYELGVTVEVGEDQQEGMREARIYRSHLAAAGKYVDYYYFIGKADRKNIFIGMTHDASEIIDTVNRRARQGTIYALAFLVILAVLCLLLLYRFAIRPLRRVQESIRFYKKTKESQIVREKLEEITPGNEIGDLAEDVSELSLEIDNYLKEIGEISAEKERINTELSLATRIQMSMLPSIFPPYPERTEFDIFASMDPAKEVGGDFYDFYMIDDDHLCMIIADVSGKGIPAALFMMAAKIIVKNNAMMGKTPAKILEDTNESVCGNNPEDMFLTMWIGILEASTGKVTAANAGHEYPAIGRAGKGFELEKDTHGFVIGGMSGMKYKEYDMQLDPGDTLFVYTDGVPEATDANNDLYGTERMIEALGASEGQDPKKILENVRSSVDDFVKDAEQFDDLTMLCVKYKG